MLSFFFCMPSSFHPFLVYGICLRNSPNIFSVFVYRVPVAPLLPSFASVGAPARARSTLEFQPASSTQSRASVPRLFARIQGETCGCGWKLKSCLGFQNLNFHSRAFSVFVLFNKIFFAYMFCFKVDLNLFFSREALRSGLTDLYVFRHVTPRKCWGNLEPIVCTPHDNHFFSIPNQFPPYIQLGQFSV